MKFKIFIHVDEQSRSFENFIKKMVLKTSHIFKKKKKKD